ncbi:protein-tyrosine-phosphatase [Lewinella sp. IMCC34183]|uniref:protein-tyrosine-phosphatase n=1 Tax=Lewinella sp. IMCC34183 TaxID=2248762 RepID=UPI000E23F394|nr:protein-tyrosine-phosphatase [Lewinella sp. IMCC34183]
MTVSDLATLTDAWGDLPAPRRSRLSALADYVRRRLDAGHPARVVAICTHNSRRSHFAQLMLALAADHYGVTGVETYSGGTEATALYPAATEALRRFGFSVEAVAGPAANPEYRVGWGGRGAVCRVFSKHYAAPPNPTRDFAALLVCDAADAGCPVVAGAALRVALPFADPKVSDGTAAQAAAYDARLREIGREMFYAMALVAGVG